MKSAGNRGVVYGRLQMLHVHVFLVAPLGARHVAKSGADQHQGGIAVRERPHHTGTPADLTVQPLDHVVGADARPVLIGESRVSQRLLQPILHLFRCLGQLHFTQGRNHILLNGRPLHLRGTVENAVFPKTGHAPVCDAEWERIMRIVKDYGLNHIRFHSWCPPAAAFRMADRHGVYLEVEMPMWGKDAEPDEARYDFFRREMRAILKEYGNHPSFVLYCNGNEITGNFDFIEELTADGRKLDTRHLYSGSTARTRVPSDQYYVSQQTNKGPVKVYEGRPSTDWDRSKESDVDVPVISHESGQRCVYPDFREIGKYTGPVEARNFELWREMLTANGMGDQAHDFFRASGALTVVEYKAVIEALLRSSKSAGFQLLSLNDFPGQGYAPVGVLDPFWDSKGLVTPEDWRAFCAPTWRCSATRKAPGSKTKPSRQRPRSTTSARRRSKMRKSAGRSPTAAGKPSPRAV